MIRFTHYRHATSIIYIGGKKILIDPLLAPRASYPPIMMTKNPMRNPLNDLLVDYRELFNVDGVLITHNHNDHFDELAKAELPRDMAILCQFSDYETFKNLGFSNVTSLNEETSWLGLQWTRYKGTHGGGILYKKLGESSSYMVRVDHQKIYFTGDTLFTGKIKRLLKKEQPHIIVANGGGARFKIGGKITMSHRDILRINTLFPSTRIVVVHMDSLNHCHDVSTVLKSMNEKKRANLIIPGSETIDL